MQTVCQKIVVYKKQRAANNNFSLSACFITLKQIYKADSRISIENNTEGISKQRLLKYQQPKGISAGLVLIYQHKTSFDQS